MENQADVGLIAACQQDDPRSFQRLFEIYRDRVYALCRHMAGNDEDAGDLTQESFVWAFKNIGSFRAEAAFGTWLYRIAFNRCLAELRKQRPQFQSVELVEKDNVIQLRGGANPEFMQITAASEIVILLAFEINSANASGLVSVCYPFFTLEPILPKLGQQSYMRLPRADREEQNRQNLLRLGAMEVPVVSELGRTKISLQEAEALTAGDVIRLPTRTTDAVPVYLGGKAKFLARPFAEANSELKLQVVDRVPAELQGKYGRVQ